MKEGLHNVANLFPSRVGSIAWRELRLRSLLHIWKGILLLRKLTGAARQKVSSSKGKIFWRRLMALPQALNWCFDMGAYCYFNFFFWLFLKDFCFVYFCSCCSQHYIWSELDCSLSPWWLSFEFFMSLRELSWIIIILLSCRGFSLIKWSDPHYLSINMPNHKGVKWKITHSERKLDFMFHFWITIFKRQPLPPTAIWMIVSFVQNHQASSRTFLSYCWYFSIYVIIVILPNSFIFWFCHLIGWFFSG